MAFTKTGAHFVQQSLTAGLQLHLGPVQNVYCLEIREKFSREKEVNSINEKCFSQNRAKVECSFPGCLTKPRVVTANNGDH